MLFAVLNGRRDPQAVVGLVVLVGLAVFVLGWSAFMLSRVPYQGGDFRSFYATGQLVLRGRAVEIYDLAAQRELQRQFVEAVGSGRLLDIYVIPTPFLPAFALLFAPLALLPATGAYYAWAGLTLIPLLVGLRWLGRALGLATWPLLLMAGGFLPLWEGLVVGQVHTIMFLGMVGFYLSLRKGEETAAGLWLSSLLLKPQYLPILMLVLAWRGQWRAARAFLIAAVIVLAVSFLLVGVEGFKGYAGLLIGYAGVEGLQTNSPEAMINWRALAINAVGARNPGAVIGSVTTLSLVTLLLVLLPWRRGLKRGDVPLAALDACMLSVMAGTLITAYHSHTHSLVLVLVPAIALLASVETEQKTAQRRLPALVDLVVFGPTLVVVVWGVALAPAGVPSTWTNVGMTLLLASVVVCVAWHFALIRLDVKAVPVPTARSGAR